MQQTRRQFLSKFKTRERWRLILASCKEPAEISEIYANQPKRSLSKKHIYKLLKLFVETKLLEQNQFNGKYNWKLTSVGKEIVELWPPKVKLTLDNFGNPDV